MESSQWTTLFLFAFYRRAGGGRIVSRPRQELAWIRARPGQIEGVAERASEAGAWEKQGRGVRGREGDGMCNRERGAAKLKAVVEAGKRED